MHSKLNGELEQFPDSFVISDHQDDSISKDFTLNEFIGASSRHQGGFRASDDLEYRFAQKLTTPLAVALKADDEISEKEREHAD